MPEPGALLLVVVLAGLVAYPLLRLGDRRARLVFVLGLAVGALTARLLGPWPGAIPCALATIATLWCWHVDARRRCLATSLAAFALVLGLGSGDAGAALLGAAIGFVWVGPSLAFAARRGVPRALEADERHRALAADLIRRAGIDLAEWYRPDRRAAAVHLLATGTLGALGVVLIVVWGPHWWARALGLVAIAVFQAAMFCWIHEAVHGLASHQRWRNELLGSVLTALGYGSFTAYRRLHLIHHRYLGGPLDPDEYRNYIASPPVRLVMHYWRLSVATLFYLPLMPILAWRRCDRGERWRMLAEIVGALGLHLLTGWVLGWDGYLWLWVLPFCLASLSINLRGLTQHVACDLEQPLLASRNVRAGRVLRFLMLGENHHLEHHLFPGVPGPRLHALHRELRPHYPQHLEVGGYLRYVLAFVAMTCTGRDDVLLGLCTRERSDSAEV